MVSARGITLIDVNEVWEKVLVVMAATEDGKFLIWADLKHDHTNIIPCKEFDSNTLAKFGFKSMVNSFVEFFDPDQVSPEFKN